MSSYYSHKLYYIKSYSLIKTVTLHRTASHYLWKFTSTLSRCSMISFTEESDDVLWWSVCTADSNCLMPFIVFCSLCSSIVPVAVPSSIGAASSSNVTCEIANSCHSIFRHVDLYHIVIYICLYFYRNCYWFYVAMHLRGWSHGQISFSCLISNQFKFLCMVVVCGPTVAYTIIKWQLTIQLAM